LRKSGSRPGVGNDWLVHDGRRTTCSSHAGLRQNDGRSAPNRRHMWCIYSKLILNCTRTMWKSERQAGETTGN
jgi:hypothetical protein